MPHTDRDRADERQLWATEAAREAHPVLSLEAALVLPTEELLGEALAHRGRLRLVLTEDERRTHADRLRLLYERDRTLSVHTIST